MKISEIDICPVKHNNGLVAFASLVYDNSIYLGSIAIHSKLSGGYRITYPTKRLADKDMNLFHPIQKDISKKIEEAIIQKYKDVMKGQYEDEDYSDKILG